MANKSQERVLTYAIIGLIFFAPFHLSAQTREKEKSLLNFTREPGDQVLTLNLGVLTPLFSQKKVGAPLTSTKMSVGGWFALSWEIHFLSMLRAGIDLGGAFSLAQTGKPIYLFNFLAKITYVPQISSFDFPISLGVGLNGIRFDQNANTDFILKPSIGFYWNINAQWSIGTTLSYVFIPQIYKGPTPPKTDSRLVNMFNTAISVRYHF